MRKVQVLAELQRLDTELDRARERLAAVLLQLKDRSSLTALESEQQSAQADLQQISLEQRDLELELQDLRDKLTKVDGQLYGGTVKNPKELEALSQDAQQFRGLISTREDKLIELYDVVETRNQALDEFRARVGVAQAAYEQSLAVLGSEREQLEATIAEAERRRAALQAEVDPQSMRTYESLRRTRAGLAVAEVAQRTCQGCRVTLPVSEEARARTSPDLVLCQSCGRILHAGI